MPFFQPEPFDSATVRYHRAHYGFPGYYRVTVRGHARNLSYGFQLKQLPTFVGGLAVQVMGWTGPLTQGTTPYHVTADFIGTFAAEVVVVGANKTEVVHVEDVAFASEEAFMQTHTSG